MIAVSIEMSTAQASLALFRDGALVATTRVGETDRRDAPVFEALTRLLNNAAAHPADVSLWIAGRGPGRYTGLRAALTLAQFFALPGGAEVYALNSPIALAAAARRETGAPIIAVIGDARRGRCWVGLFRFTSDGLPQLEGDWTLQIPKHLGEVIPSEAVCVSSEYERLLARDLLPPQCRKRWIEGDRFPESADLGSVALARRRAGILSEPAMPLYLHAAVALSADGLPGPRSAESK